MKLSVPERLHLLGVLPAEGNIVNMRIVRDLRKQAEFTAEEIELYEMKVAGEQVTWNVEKIVEVDFTLGTQAMVVIVEALEKLNGENKLTPDTAALYDKFVT
jgi:hypothetical protein